MPLKTGTMASSLSNQWLILAEAFQDRLLQSTTADLTHALSLLRDPVLDVLITGENPFEDLPRVMQRLAAGDAGSR